MFTALLLLSALVVLVFAFGAMIMVSEARRAPEGYEDAEGFHTGPTPVATIAADHPWFEQGVATANAQNNPPKRVYDWPVETHGLAT